MSGLDTFLGYAIPTIAILSVIGLLYAKVSYVRQFVAWAWGKITEKKEEVRERLDRREYTRLAFKYGGE